VKNTATMTAREMMPAIGQRVIARFESLLIVVSVKDERFVWGKPQVQITPLHGTGLQWVELGRISSLESRGPCSRNDQLVS
jgi:hypothetical protein